MSASHTGVDGPKAFSQAPAFTDDPFESLESLRQPGEADWHFQSRLVAQLPPAHTAEAKFGRCLWVPNPFADRTAVEENLPLLMTCGQQILRDWMSQRVSWVEDEDMDDELLHDHAVQVELAGWRAVVEKELRDLAVSTNIVTGKWMMYADEESFRCLWRKVVLRTAMDALGFACKLTTYRPFRGQDRYVISVCTHDFTDLADVRRVLQMLIMLGIASVDHAIYYKCDAYAHLGIEANNPYGFQHTLYSSRQILRANTSIGPNDPISPSVNPVGTSALNTLNPTSSTNSANPSNNSDVPNSSGSVTEEPTLPIGGDEGSTSETVRAAF
ncbi:MAG: hypothetical protein M1826_002772 [Phylliscum demangeonii]|nr:MAG: hypothetical protein M1826_002772 [Phylliscum demangeonii]